MSIKLLNYLNGNRRGLFKQFLASFSGTPRIAWYPSCGEDFEVLKYLNRNFSSLNPSQEIEPEHPDLFLFTDVCMTRRFDVLNENVLFSKTNIEIKTIEHEILPELNLSYQEGMLHMSPSIDFNKVVYLKVRMIDADCGIMDFHVLYVYAENFDFYRKVLKPCKAKFSHVIKVRYGISGNNIQSQGAWILHLLNDLGCELFITDGLTEGRNSDTEDSFYEDGIYDKEIPNMRIIRILKDCYWSDNGQITWNLIE